MAETYIKYDVFTNEWERTNMNWIGKYTFGSCHVRGTSINLFPHAGKIIEQGICTYDLDKFYPAQDYVIPKNEEALFRIDDSALCLEGFDVKRKFMTDKNRFIPTPLIDEFEFEFEHGEAIVKELNENPTNTFYMDCGFLILISLKVPEQLILDEIEEVEKIAHEHHVTLIWV